MVKNIAYRFLQNLVSLFAVKGLELALTLGLIPFLIIKVGVENYGKYAFAMALVLFFVNMLNYGFDLTVVRDLAKNKKDLERVNQLFNEVFSVKLFLLAVVYAIIILLILFVPRFKEDRMIYFYASTLLFGDFFSIRWFFLGFEKMKFITIISLVSTLIYLGLVLIFVKGNDDYIYIAVCEAVGLFTVSLISFLMVIKQYEFKIELLSFNGIMKYLQNHFYSYLNLFVPSTSGVLIIFLVGLFGLPNNVAVMQIGVKFCAAFTTVNTVLTTLFYPMVNRDRLNSNISRITLLSSGFCLSIFMYITGAYIVSHWIKFDNVVNYMNTIVVIKYLSPVPFFMAIISSYGVNGLLVRFEDKLYSWITIITTFLMIVLAIVLVPKQPVLGGAISFLISRIVYATLLYCANLRLHSNFKEV